MTEKSTSGEARPTIEQDLALIRDAAEKAGQIALSYFRGHHDMDVRMKDGRSPVSAGDLAADSYLRETLLAARPDYGWLSEESVDVSRTKRLTAPRSFIVDPIDGTRAFIDGRDIWCVSIGVVEGHVPIAGVLECPALKTRYWASAGGGAWKDGDRLAVSTPRPRPVVAAPAKAGPQLERAFPGGYERHGHIPSLAYRLAMVADGSLDATLVKPRAHDWDIAAAMLILAEAGARLTDFDGVDVRLNEDDVVKPEMMAGPAGMLGAMFGVVTAQAFG
ncbi:3'(2'),5'-bisphosphate nucleotidase CysQ [Oricola indica]|uniref:3'(2'),5'-bisphosphate nucleotidase CysQ n=1 Tax=Oricola indica TaxID=2872591 RepID=UPI003CCB8298